MEDTTDYHTVLLSLFFVNAGKESEVIRIGRYIFCALDSTRCSPWDALNDLV